MKILGIIPARGGSKRIPGKNTKLFCGRPLIEYIIESSLHSKFLDRIVINSDDEKVLNIGSKYPEIIRIKRPDELSGDKARAIEYVRHTIDVLNQGNNEQFDIVVILQPTSPLTTGEDIDNTIQILINAKSDSAVSVMKLNHAIHPVKMKTMEKGRLFPFIEEENGRMAEDELPEIYVRNCSVYASTINTIQQNKIIGDDCRGYLMPSIRSVDINDLLDFEFAEFLMTKQLKQKAV